jgi:DNA-binding winged helix-turn-helix (wHTH) protein
MDSRATHRYEFGPYLLEPAECRLLRRGRVVSLTPKLFDLLLVLVQHNGHILKKEELLEAVWPDAVVEENNLSVSVSALRKALGEDSGASEYIETIPRRGYRFVARVREVSDEPDALMIYERRTASIVIDEEEMGGEDDQSLEVRQSAAASLSAPSLGEELEPVGGAVPLDSRFYIVRQADEEFITAVSRKDSIVLVKGARQVGKTSLLARGLERAREQGARVVLTDFQMLNEADLSTVESLFLTLAEWIAYRLDLPTAPRAVWDPLSSPNLNFERYWQSHVLAHISLPVLWGLDEVDRLFTRPFAGEVFGLFRSWHNARALDPQGLWENLTLAIAYATEAHLFISDLNQSPFNVGTRLLLEDFTIQEVAELNRRYGSPLREAREVEAYFRLVGGNPYLVRCGLHQLAVRRCGLALLEVDADHDDGPFGNHLRRLLTSLMQAPALCEAVREILRGQPCPTADSFYRLRSAGIIAGYTARDARLRCPLYPAYLARHLL